MKQMTEADGPAAWDKLGAIPSLDVRWNEPLSLHTRFGIGGPADVVAIAHTTAAFSRATALARESGLPWVVIGGGTNLVVSDSGFRGLVLKLEANAIQVDPSGWVDAEAGAVLQDLVDRSVAAGLRGLETMTGIPGWVGAAVYGNAGAYGHSISEFVEEVVFLDGAAERRFGRADCGFRYRDSVFKSRKDWIILRCRLLLTPADAQELKNVAGEILRTRNEKYPPSMRCAGSIFKNFLWADLPAEVRTEVPAKVVREGKVPSAWFLEQVGAKGLRIGDIQVATYHANLIYNDGAGTAADLVDVIRELQRRIRERFGMRLEEEVQYVGDFSG